MLMLRRMVDVAKSHRGLLIAAFVLLLALAFVMFVIGELSVKIGLAGTRSANHATTSAPPPVVANTIKLGTQLVNLIAVSGNPNGTACTTGDTAWDVGTPGFWQCRGGTTWAAAVDGGPGTVNAMTQWTGTSTIGNSLMATDGNGDLKYGSGALALWSSTSLSTGTADTGIARNAAGVLEVDNGTAGTLRDLTLRNLTVQNGSLGTGSGQSALFTTPRPSGTDGNNICIGGGCTSLAFNATVGVHSASSITSLGIGAANAFGSGADIVAIGSFALDSAAGSQATQITAVGASAMINATGAIGFDTAVGQGALENTTAGDNTALGQAAMLQQTSGGSNTAVGVQALEGGAGATCILDVAVGLASNQLCTTGAANTAIGYQSMANATSASSNVAVGYNAAGSGAMTGNRNVCVGVNACSVVDAGYGNTQIGNQAGSGVTSGSQNTIVGPVNASFVGTGAGITTGNYNTILGSVTGLASGLSNNIIIADGQGNISYQDAAGSATIFSPVKIGGWISSPSAPSANHGTLSTGATGAWGQVTSIGSFTSVALTWASAFANDSLCTTQPNSTSVAIENIVVTAHSASAVTFSCFSVATGVAANCDDFTYTCAGR